MNVIEASKKLTVRHESTADSLVMFVFYELLWRQSGLALIHQKLNPKPDQAPQPSLCLWFLSLYVGFFTIVIDRYERRVISYDTQVQSWLDDFRTNPRNGFSSIDALYSMSTPSEPFIEQPLSIFRSFFAAPVRNYKKEISVANYVSGQFELLFEKGEFEAISNYQFSTSSGSYDVHLLRQLFPNISAIERGLRYTWPPPEEHDLTAGRQVYRNHIYVAECPSSEDLRMLDVQRKCTNALETGKEMVSTQDASITIHREFNLPHGCPTLLPPKCSFSIEKTDNGTIFVSTLEFLQMINAIQE